MPSTPPPTHSLTLTHSHNHKPLDKLQKDVKLDYVDKASRVTLILTLTHLFPNFAAHCNLLVSLKNNLKSYSMPVRSECLGVEAR